MKARVKWLQLLALQALLLCTIARERSCPQPNEVLDSMKRLKDNVPCNSTCVLKKLVKLQKLRAAVISATCHLAKYTMPELLPPHSQLVPRVQFAAKVTAKLFEEIAEAQQRLTALHHNLTRHNSEVESVIHVMHTTLLALDALMLNLTDHMQAVETLTLNASLAVNWIKSAHSAATYNTENALLVTFSNGMVEHNIAQITELSNDNILNIVNTLRTQQMVATMADDFEMLSSLSEKTHGSLAQLIKDSECSLDKSSMHIIKATDYLEESTALISEIRSALAEYEHEVMEFGAHADMGQQHAMMLDMQLLSIARMAAAAGIFDFPDETDRLLAIQTTVGVALQTSETAVRNVNVTATVTHHSSEILEKQLQSANSTNTSLNSLLLQLEYQAIRLVTLSITTEDTRRSWAVVQNQTVFEYQCMQTKIEGLWSQAGETQQQADISMGRVGRINISIGSVQNISENIQLNIEEAESCNMIVELELVELNFIVLELKNTTAAINQSLQDFVNLIQDVSSLCEIAERASNSAFYFLDQVSYPVKFVNNTLLTRMSNSTDSQSRELRSISLNMNADQVEDILLVHCVTLWQHVNQNVSVTIGILEGSVYASFVYSHPEAGVDSTNLTISNKNVEPFQTYSIEITRTERNVHLFLVDVGSGEEYSVSSSTSGRITFIFQSDFHQGQVINIGGVPNGDYAIENTPFAAAGNFTGCIGSVSINGVQIPLWQMASQNTLPCRVSSLENFIQQPQLSFEGLQYAQTNVSGNIFPLHITFRSLLPNGFLMLAKNEEASSSLQIGLKYGHIVVRVDVGSRHRTLVSSGIYHSGSRQNVTVMLTQSMRGLLLRTRQEQTVRGLRNIAAEEVVNYSEVFVGGVPQEVEVDIRVGNFTGCVRISSAAMFETPSPLCTVNRGRKECSYCLNQAVLSASFYGASYAEFPPISVGDDFDISFSFRTSFPEGLIVYSGNVSEQGWIAVVLLDSQFHLIFGSLFGNIDLPARSPPLNNNQWHSAAIVKAGTRLDLFLNGTNAGSFPFGSLMPSGTLGTNLYIGSIDPGSVSVLHPGVSSEGFKGCLDMVYVMGRALDFSENQKSEQLAFGTCTNTNGNNNQDVYSFGESSIAEYDLGRFEQNFSIGFQLRTLVQTGLIFYLFSRRVDDVFAVQMIDGKLQLYTASSTEDWLASSHANISNGLWHSVLVEKVVNTTILTVDGEVEAEATAPTILRTNSPLYIGGLPGNRRVPRPSIVTSKGFVGCLMASFLSYSHLSNVMPNRCVIGSATENN